MNTPMLDGIRKQAGLNINTIFGRMRAGARRGLGGNMHRGKRGIDIMSISNPRGEPAAPNPLLTEFSEKMRNVQPYINYADSPNTRFFKALQRMGQ